MHIPGLVPESMVPEQTPVIGQAIILQIHCIIEHYLGAHCRSVVQRPEKLFIRPSRVGVTSKDERHEILLHCDSYCGVY